MARHKALFTHNEILPDISLARNSHTKLSRIEFWCKWGEGIFAASLCCVFMLCPVSSCSVLCFVIACFQNTGYFLIKCIWNKRSE